jgi:hypothetical protein
MAHEWCGYYKEKHVTSRSQYTVEYGAATQKRYNGATQGRYNNIN